MCDHVTERIMASSREQRKEIPNAKNRKIKILPHSNSSLLKPSPIVVNIVNKFTRLFPSPRVKRHYICEFSKNVIDTIQELETSDMICPIGPQIHIKSYKVPYLYLCIFLPQSL